MASIFDSGVIVALAKVEAELNSHLVSGAGRVHCSSTIESTRGVAIASAADKAPALACHVCEGRVLELLVRGDGCRDVSALRRFRIGRAILYRVAAGKAGQYAEDGLANLRWHLTVCLLVFRKLIDGRAIFLLSGSECGVAVTLVGDLLEDLDIPAVQEVAMEAVTGRITIAKDERLGVAIPVICEKIGGVQHFEEQADGLSGVAGTAWAVVVTPGSRIAHVALVVFRIEASVPATWEVKLRTETTRAVLLNEVSKAL